MSNPLITIGITCYNAQDTIERAIKSAQTQNYLQYEIIIVDDCSTDTSFDIVRKIAEQDVRIVPIQHKENKGPAGTRNTILHKAKGDYIAFFDDDDEADPSRIGYQYECLQESEQKYQTKLIACYASGIRIYPNGYTLHLPAIGSRGTPPYGSVMADYLLHYKRYKDVDYGAGVPSCALMIGRETLLQMGGFDEQLRRVEDIDVAIRLGLSGGIFVGTKQALYTQYATSAIDKTPEKNRDSEIFLAEKYHDYLQETGMYAYAKLWPQLRYAHFKRTYGRFLVILFRLILQYPLKTPVHLFSTGPKRLRHEKKMRKE